MTYTPTVYTWRSVLVPLSTLFTAGGASIPGGMTLGGFTTESPEPGGRAELDMAFAPLATEAENLAASWTMSRIMNGNILSIPIHRTVQLVTESALDVEDTGQTWANGEPWANDETWRAEPFAPVAAAALAGQERFSVDLSVTGQVLQIGHVVGFFLDGYSFAHIVMDIEYDEADEALVTISPPLRRDLAVTDHMLFRPSITAVCQNPREVRGLFQRGRHVALGAAKFIEALV